MPRLRPLGLMLLLLLGLSLAGCAPPWPKAHKIDIQQGNVITQEMIEELEIGMSRRDVQFVMGSPMLVSPFRENRWDYIYTLRPSRGERERRHVVLHFENDRLARIGGDSVEVGDDGRVTLKGEIDFIAEDWDADPDTTPLDEPLQPQPGQDPGGPGAPAP